MKKYFLLASVLLLFLVSSVAVQAGQSAKKGSFLSALSRRESRLWDAWKNHQAAPFRSTLSWDTVLVGETGAGGKEDTIKGILSTDCEVKDFALSDFKLTMFNNNTALLNYRGVQHVTCSGAAQPVNIVASSLWIKRRGKWYVAFHQETPGTPQ